MHTWESVLVPTDVNLFLIRGAKMLFTKKHVYLWPNWLGLPQLQSFMKGMHINLWLTKRQQDICLQNKCHILSGRVQQYNKGSYKKKFKKKKLLSERYLISLYQLLLVSLTKGFPCFRGVLHYIAHQLPSSQRGTSVHASSALLPPSTIVSPFNYCSVMPLEIWSYLLW